MHDPDITIAHINLARGYRGGERQTQLLIQELDRLGRRQVLVARQGEPLAENCENIDGLEIRQVIGHVLSGVRALHGVDLVHVHEGRSLQSAFMNRLVRRTPYLVTRRIQKGPHITRLNRSMYRHAAGIVAVSAAIGESLDRLGLDHQVQVIQDASSRLHTDPKKVAGIRAAIGGQFLVGHVGELDDSHKGQLQVIELARRLGPENPGMVFVFVGSGRDEMKLRSAATDLPNVYFTGYVDDVGNYLAAFDAFIYPSRHEGLGSILLDALEFGLPVIATAVGGIPEVVEAGTNGFLYAVDDIDAQAEAVRRLCRDVGLREQFAQANRRAAEHYLPKRMAKQYAEVYADLVDFSERQQARI